MFQSQIIRDFLPNDQLPPRQEVETICLDAGLYGRGIAIRKLPGGPVIAWVKYGVNVTMAEALTQDWAARDLAADPTTFVHIPRVFDAWITALKSKTNVGHIVMEYIDLPNCEVNRADSQRVAEAVQRMHAIKAPIGGSAPSPVGGGSIKHRFFYDWNSDITYETVEELKEHINRVSKLSSLECQNGPES